MLSIIAGGKIGSKHRNGRVACLHPRLPFAAEPLVIDVWPGKPAGDEAVKIGTENGTTFTFKETYLSTPAMMEQGVQKVIEASAKSLGMTTKYLPSGAGHDAQYMAQICPTGMIFCPSAGGISHSPKEFTKPQDVTNGANVLLQTILALDAQ